MGSHTPGPWFAAGDLIRAEDYNGKSPAVAQVTSEGTLVDHYLANRDLIAAAPELLSSLEGFMEWYEMYGYEHDNTCDKVMAEQTCDCPVPKARAAIRKARGAEG